MSVVLAVERSRAKNFKLLKIIREISAICLARNIHLAVRRIPSELTMSDEPSRLFDPTGSDLLVDLLDVSWPNPPQLQQPHQHQQPHVEEETQRAAPECPGSGRECFGKESSLSRSGACSGGRSSDSPAFLEPVKVLGLQSEQRFVEPKINTFKLPQTNKDLEKLEQQIVLHQPDLARTELWSSDASSAESEMQVVRRGDRRRGLESKPKDALKQLVDRGMTAPGGLSLLEAAAVTPRVRQNYVRRLKDFMGYVERNRLPIQKSADMDEALVRFFTHRYLSGEGSFVGDYTMAALMDSQPQLESWGASVCRGHGAA